MIMTIKMMHVENKNSGWSHSFWTRSMKNIQGIFFDCSVFNLGFHFNG